MLRSSSSSTSSTTETKTHSDYALYLLAKGDNKSLETVLQSIKDGNAVLLSPAQTSTSSSSSSTSLHKYNALVIQKGNPLLDDAVEIDNENIDATPSCTIPLSTPHAAILVKKVLEKAEIIKVAPRKKAKSLVSIDLRMPLSGKNIINKDASRTPQGSTSKLKHLSNVLSYFPVRDERWSCLDTKDSTCALVNLSMSCVTLYRQTEMARQKRALEQLLQAMFDHYPLKVSSILKSYPELLSAKPEAHNITEIESQFTWLRYLTAGESVFSMAQKLLLVDMLKIMLPHYLKQLDDAQRAPDAKHHVLELQKQWILPGAPTTALEEKKREETQKVLQEKYTRDYLSAPLAALAADTTIRVSWVENPETKHHEAQIEHISPATVKALEDLRTKLFEPKAIQDCIDIYQLLIAAYHAYDSNFDRLQDWHRRDACAILMIGFILSLVNPSLGKIYCEDFYGVVYDNKKISPRAESLVLIDRRPFYRATRDSHVGHGFNFLCSIVGAAWPGGGVALPGRGAAGVTAHSIRRRLENYVKQMYQSVTALRSECTIETNLPPRPSHHRGV
jgi:hypothetical protein